jgi:hypothetical protein
MERPSRRKARLNAFPVETTAVLENKSILNEFLSVMASPRGCRQDMEVQQSNSYLGLLGYNSYSLVGG